MDDKKENLTTRINNDNNKIHLVLIVIALVVAVVSFIVACVGISLKGTTEITVPTPSGTTVTSDPSGDKIWSIAIGHANYNLAYIDEESGKLKGFLVDMTNAVCKTANKNCRIVYDVWHRCWDSEAGQVARGGIGLMGNWYDACAGWVGTYDRYRTFAFSRPFGKEAVCTLYAKPGSALKFSWQDMTGKKIGILDGWATDELCLSRNQDKFTGGVPFGVDQIVHYTEPPELVDGILNGEVDYAFSIDQSHVSQELERVDGDPVLSCSVHGPAVMLRKVNQAFLDWYNPAQKELMATSEYKQICQDLTEEHGDQPGRTPESFCFL